MRLITIGFAAAAVLMTACGGGSGSSPAPTPVTCTAPQVLTNGACVTPVAISAPTVSISIDSASITLGASAKLTWSSTDSTSCTASGGWSGTQAISGTATKTPTAVGSSAFMLTCTGAGGASSQTATLTVVAAPDPCSVAAHVYGEVTSPAEYSGAFAIPTPAGRLPAHITKAVAFKDYYPGYLPQGGACTDRIAHARNLYVETLNRMQADGVQQTYIYNYGRWDDFKKPVWSVNPSDYQIPASEVAFVVSEASKRGIKVVLTWQFTDTDKVGGSLGMGQPVTAERLSQMLASFHPLIVEQARVGTQIGLSGIYVDWNSFWVPNLQADPALREIWINEMVSIVADIRKVFSGKIYYGSNTFVIDSRIAAVIDQFTISLTVPYNSISVAQNNALSVDMVRNAFLTSIQNSKADYDQQMTGSKISVPINWVVAVQSKKDYFINGWTEDGFCVTSGTNPCIQLTYVTDNSVQAIGTEAALQAITAQTQFTTGTINFDTSYWLTDDVIPVDYGWSSFANVHQYDFPNLSQSIRNKPAEGIVRYWFGK